MARSGRWGEKAVSHGELNLTVNGLGYDDRREKPFSEDPSMTDAEMFELLGWSYEPCQAIVFNQDGEMFYSDVEMAGWAGFAVQGERNKNPVYIHF